MVDDLNDHLTTIHQTQIETLNSVKQCSLCGFTCDQKKPSSLFEHQLLTHTGVCYSSTLKQFIRFEPPPSRSLPVNGKDHARLILPSSSSSGRVLVTQTDKVTEYFFSTMRVYSIYRNLAAENVIQVVDYLLSKN